MGHTEDDERNTIRFRKEFNNTYQIANHINSRFQSTGWVADMALGNCHDMYMIYGVKSLNQIKEGFTLWVSINLLDFYGLSFQRQKE